MIKRGAGAFIATCVIFLLQPIQIASATSMWLAATGFSIVLLVRGRDSRRIIRGLQVPGGDSNHSFRILLVLVGVAVLVIAQPAFAVVFSDDTFDLANYSPPLVYQNGIATITPQQITSGGNPGEAFQVLYTIPAVPHTFESMIALMRPSFAYEPATQGAIGSIAFRR